MELLEYRNCKLLYIVIGCTKEVPRNAVPIGAKVLSASRKQSKFSYINCVGDSITAQTASGKSKSKVKPQSTKTSNYAFIARRGYKHVG